MPAFVTILSLFVACACGVSVPGGLIPSEPKAKGIRRIVGGTDAFIENFPYMVTLRHFETHRCGGALISKKAVLTAGHCVDGVMKQFADIRLGATFREKDKDEIIAPIKRFSLHASYHKGATIDYDIAVVALQDPVTLSPKVQPIPLPKPNEPLPYGEYGRVTGFGRTSEGGAVPTQLQALCVPVLKEEACQQAYGSGFTERMLCAGFTDGKKDACQQDSGGPYVVSGKLFGVVSWALGCARVGYPGVYANVPYFSDWIEFTMNL